MIRIKAILACMLASLFFLTACQTATSKKAGLSPAEIAVLKKEGFVQSAEGWEFSASEKLLFGSDEAVLTQSARQTVERIARLLISMEILNLRVDGHTDTTGSQTYNDQLSLRRAQAVAEAIETAGMPSGGMKVRGLGSRMPVVSNQTAEGRAQNRRVVLVIAGD